MKMNTKNTLIPDRSQHYESCGANAVLDCSQPPEEDLQPIVREEVEIAVASLKKGKSAGVDNIPAELVQASGETMIDVLTEICNRICRTGVWPTPWTQSLIITLPKKGNLQLCQNYRTISLISHSSKVMLKVILNRLKPQEIIAEEQAGLVGCFVFNDPLRQYFSLYRAVSQRGRKRRERIDESKNVQTIPTRTFCKRSRPLPYCNRNCRTPWHWKFT